MATPLPPKPAPAAQQAGPAIITGDYPRMDDELSEKLAKDDDEIERFYVDQLMPNWQDVVAHERLYLNARREWRKPHEMWRSDIRVPRAYVNVEAKAAQMVEILTSSDPIIQAGEVGAEDRKLAQEIEGLMDAALEGNQVRRLLANTSRWLSIAGTDWWTSRYGRNSFTINMGWTPEDREYHSKKTAELMQKTQQGGVSMVPPPPDWTTDPKAYEQWRNDVNLNFNADIPEPPLDGPREIVTYEGPIIERCRPFEMRFDPLVQDRKQQSRIIRRFIRNDAWVKRLVDQGIFDEQRVADAGKGWDGKRIDDYEQEIASQLGYSVSSRSDPTYKNAHEILVVYDLENKEWPYRVIMNRKHVVNMRPDQLPYHHGECEFVPVRNVLVPGYMAGLSDLKHSTDLFHELNQIRSLRLDAVKLGVLPVLAKSPDVGMTELQKHIQPGAILNVRNPAAIVQLIKLAIPDYAFREPQEILNDIDEATAVPPHVRGAQAQINRVSASESTGRLQQALLRIKMNGGTVEDDLQAIIPHFLSHWIQFGKPELLSRVNGRGTSKVSTLRKQDVLRAFHFDLRFRGATRSQNREMLVQQLTTFVKEFQAQLAPVEVRAVMKDIYENMGLKSVSTVIDPKYTAMQQAMWEQQMMGQQQANAQQKTMNDATAAGAPAVVSGDQARALQGGQQ